MKKISLALLTTLLLAGCGASLDFSDEELDRDVLVEEEQVEDEQEDEQEDELEDEQEDEQEVEEQESTEDE